MTLKISYIALLELQSEQLVYDPVPVIERTADYLIPGYAPHMPFNRIPFPLAALDGGSFALNPAAYDILKSWGRGLNPQLLASEAALNANCPLLIPCPIDKIDHKTTYQNFYMGRNASAGELTTHFEAEAYVWDLGFKGIPSGYRFTNALPLDNRDSATCLFENSSCPKEQALANEYLLAGFQTALILGTAKITNKRMFLECLADNHAPPKSIKMLNTSWEQLTFERDAPGIVARFAPLGLHHRTIPAGLALNFAGVQASELGGVVETESHPLFRKIYYENLMFVADAIRKTGHLNPISVLRENIKLLNSSNLSVHYLLRKDQCLNGQTVDFEEGTSYNNYTKSEIAVLEKQLIQLTHRNYLFSRH